MGGRASSSKRKLKRDKISSKKKSRRKESTKHRRRYDSARSSSDDDSLYSERSLSTSKSNLKRRTSRIKKRRHDSSSSSYSDYQSVSSDSDSSSTDGYEYKIRKARRTRVGLKDTKRKVRKKSTSSFVDEDTFSGRKRKRVGRDHDIRPIKRSSKKKPKKDLTSSSDSDSESCSACPSGSSSSRESDNHKRKRVVIYKEKGRRRRRESKKGKQKHKDRSPSCTLIGRDSNPGFTLPNSDEVFIPVDYSRRLRSVITFVDQPYNQEENKWEKDPQKEEIVYDQNDYPSPKSLDSNEDGTKIDSYNQFNVAFSDRVLDTENIADNEVGELEKSRIDEGDRSNAGGCKSERGFLNNSEEKEFDKSVPVTALGGNVLESILRQKALENLRKFQKKPQASPRSNMMKTNNKTNEVGLPDGTVDTIPNESTEQDRSGAQEQNPGSRILLQRETAAVVKLPDGEQVGKKPESAKLNITHSEDDKSARSVVAKAVSGSNTSPRARVCNSSNVEPTATKPISGEHSSEQNNEAKEGSQFEQKTMSVMRGGELVQVSYKVYIPNKSQALARRQLRR